MWPSSLPTYEVNLFEHIDDNALEGAQSAEQMGSAPRVRLLFSHSGAVPVLRGMRCSAIGTPPQSRVEGTERAASSPHAHRIPLDTLALSPPHISIILTASGGGGRARVPATRGICELRAGQQRDARLLLRKRQLCGDGGASSPGTSLQADVSLSESASTSYAEPLGARVRTVAAALRSAARSALCEVGLSHTEHESPSYNALHLVPIAPRHDKESAKSPGSSKATANDARRRIHVAENLPRYLMRRVAYEIQSLIRRQLLHLRLSDQSPS